MRRHNGTGETVAVREPPLQLLLHLDDSSAAECWCEAGPGCSPLVLHAVPHHQEGAAAVGEISSAVLDCTILVLVDELLHLGINASNLDGGLLTVVAVLQDVLVDLQGAEGGRKVRSVNKL
jgi:hypothetical protein